MARQRRNFGGHGGSKRMTSWIGPADQGFIAVAADGASIISSISSGNVDTGTVVRSRGEVGIVPASFAADVEIVGAYGIGIVSTQAFGIGITAIPHPFTDSDWDGWFVWRSFNYALEFQDAAGVRDATHRLEIDSKAMRKLEGDYTMVAVAESQSVAFRISAPVRHLFKLP